MNKKGCLGKLVILLAIVIVIYFVSGIIMADYKDYKEYKDFCEEREDFCYCESFECNFMISFTTSCG